MKILTVVEHPGFIFYGAYKDEAAVAEAFGRVFDAETGKLIAAQLAEWRTKGTFSQTLSCHRREWIVFETKVQGA